MTEPSPTHLNPFDRARLVQRTHYAPHDVLGRHIAEDGQTIFRTIQCGADSVELLADDQQWRLANTGDNIFEILVPQGTGDTGYKYRVTWGGHSAIIHDPYNSLPTVGELDLHLIGEGRHERLWEALGARVLGNGVSFSVWAPHAAGVAVIGDFNGWNPNQHPMRSLGSSGIWEIYIPEVQAGAHYKFAITTEDGILLDKADPLARFTEPAPATASIVTAPSTYQWTDNQWLARRQEQNILNTPMSIYEVHLGSWRKGLTYQELARQLAAYVKEKGFTHVELMGVSEHPYEPSWGYQVTSYYAPNNRYGNPDDFRALVDTLHAENIGVIMDWVPGHFPRDAWALARFDGQACYEHPDPRRGDQPDWGTHVFDFGRNEVKNFLVANALYWCREFHIDGLRVDAVASMLYLDYSRDEGQWLPNIYGGRENLDAVSFLQEMNATVHRDVPGVLTIAEESTSWTGVTKPTHENGLGFSLKWNMGWMHDTLEYIQRDPMYRSHHHGEITFSMIYAYSENYVLPFSHDEVVHGKGSLWQRMPADNAWDKAAMLRSLLAYMWSHPGKKLLFQGQEFGQISEWNENQGVQWGNLEGWEGEYHRGLQALTQQLNELYTQLPALGTDDHTPEGFRWIAADDSDNNVLSYLRRSADGTQWAAIVVNFSGVSHEDYRIGLPYAGTWKQVLNTDEQRFEGADRAQGDFSTEELGAHGYPHSAVLELPAHSAQFYVLTLPQGA